MFISEKILHRSMPCPQTCCLKSRNNRVFLPGKANSSFKILCTEERVSPASATNAAFSAGQETRHNPVPLRLPTCPSLRYFRSHSLAVDTGTPYPSLAVLADTSDDTFANRPLMVSHGDENEELLA
jgi:hypothetical protein